MNVSSAHGLQGLAPADIAVLFATVCAALLVVRLTAGALQNSFLYLLKLAVGIAFLRAAEALLEESTVFASIRTWGVRAGKVASAAIAAVRAAIS